METYVKGLYATDEYSFFYWNAEVVGVYLSRFGKWSGSVNKPEVLRFAALHGRGRSQALVSQRCHRYQAFIIGVVLIAQPDTFYSYSYTSYSW